MTLVLEGAQCFASDMFRLEEGNQRMLGNLNHSVCTCEMSTASYQSGEVPHSAVPLPGTYYQLDGPPYEKCCGFSLPTAGAGIKQALLCASWSLVTKVGWVRTYKCKECSALGTRVPQVQ